MLTDSAVVSAIGRTVRGAASASRVLIVQTDIGVAVAATVGTVRVRVTDHNVVIVATVPGGLSGSVARSVQVV